VGHLFHFLQQFAHRGLVLFRFLLLLDNNLFWWGRADALASQFFDGRNCAEGFRFSFSCHGENQTPDEL